MKRLFGLIFGICFLLNNSAYSDTDTTRPSIFSTSTDWESVTGLRYSQFDIVFTRDYRIGVKGMEMYFLDGFPCIGQAQTARVWVSPTKISDKDKKARMNISCVQRPTEVRFAWREAGEQDTQDKTIGIMVCQTKGQGTELSVILQDCVKGKNWDE